MAKKCEKKSAFEFLSALWKIKLQHMIFLYYKIEKNIIGMS